MEARQAKGERVKQLENRPAPLNTFENHIWTQFWKLRHGILAGSMGGLNGISYRDILAWIEVEQPYFSDLQDKRDFVRILLALDKEFLTLQHERTKKNG